MLKIKQYFTKFLYRFRKSKIKAIHEDDLVDTLESLGILGKINKGQSTCYYCGEVVNIKNIEAIFSKNGKINFICSNPKCISKI